MVEDEVPELAGMYYVVPVGARHPKDPTSIDVYKFGKESSAVIPAPRTFVRERRTIAGPVWFLYASYATMAEFLDVFNVTDSTFGRKAPLDRLRQSLYPFSSPFFLFGRLHKEKGPNGVHNRKVTYTVIYGCTHYV